MNGITVRLLTAAVLLSLVLLVPGARAGVFTCRADVNRTTVPQGETISLTVTAEGDVSWSAEFKLPEMEGVQVFGGSTNQSVSYVNGQTMTTASRSYFLRVDRDQDFTIGRIAVISDGATCQTDPIPIKVSAAAPGGQIPPANTGNRVARPREQEPPDPEIGGQAGDDNFITLEADADEVWLGQQVILSFKWYSRIQVWNNPVLSEPRSEGFWRQVLGQDRRYQAVVKGRQYKVVEKRYVLFPTRTGELTIEPAELAFPDQGLDRFFSSRRRTGPRTLRTAPLTIRVKALPPDQPADFSGLVASDVRLEAVVDRDSVPRGEPVDWKIQLVSDGFLQAFDKLVVPAVEGARTHDAGEEFATQEDNNRLMSAITVEKVIVPGKEGLLDVPRIELSWFDTDTGRYQTARSPRRRLLVNPSNLPYQPEEDSGFLRSEVARLAQDLAFIHNVPGRLGMGMWSPTRSAAWWLALLLPLVLLAGWRLYLVRLSAERRDPAARRRRRALKQARATLDGVAAQAELATNLTLVARAVSGFVADCLDAPVASIGPAEVESFCAKLGAAETGGRLRGILDLTETARFGGYAAPGSPENAADPAALAAEAGRLLADLARMIGPTGDHSRSKGRSRAGAAPTALLLVLLAAGTAVLMPGPVRAEADPARLMAEGNQAYTAGDLDKTLELYLEAEALGARDPHLFFNLGNTYARRGELGRAVASYLRAQHLAPRDPDIARNLAWVRGHIADLELGEQELPLFIAQFVWLARNFTVREWAFLLVALVWLLAGLIAWGWHREAFTDGLRRSGLVTGALLLVVLGIFTWRWYGQEVRVQAVIIAPEISVHSGPADSFPVLFKLHDGLTVSLEGRQEGWARISLGGESIGWLPEEGVLAVNRRHGR